MTDIRLSLLSLPPEILSSIALLTYGDGNETVASLRDLSSTCKLFREITIPILFHTKSLAISANLSQTQDLLRSEGPQWLKHVNTLVLTSEAEFSTLTNQHVSQMCAHFSRLFKMFTGLRTLQIETCHTTPPSGLSSLQELKLHVILNFQNGGVGFNARKWEAFFSLHNWRWSICVPKYHCNSKTLSDEYFPDLIALKRDITLGISEKDTWLRMGKDSHRLEELHIIDEQIDIALGEEPEIRTQVGKILRHTPCLRRLRLEGSIVVWHLLPEISSLEKLRHLTIYSGWKIAFHRMCTDRDSIPAKNLPWLCLPNLRYLDVRFICRHFSIQQVVPNGLLGLRMEFFGPKDCLSVADLRWLQAACPDLERLELDIGDFCMDGENKSRIPQETVDRLDAISGFRHLHTLRFFPMYWKGGKLLRHPLQSKSWPVHLFTRLQKQITSLRELHICMSYGEYPFDAVPRTFEENRPLKFRVRRVSESERTMRYGFAYSTAAMELTYREGVESVAFKDVCVRLHDFFDDLDHGWNIQHSDYVGNHQRVDEDED